MMEWRRYTSTGVGLGCNDDAGGGLQSSLMQAVTRYPSPRRKSNPRREGESGPSPISGQVHRAYHQSGIDLAGANS